MITHRAVIEVGSDVIRRLCCDAVVDVEMVSAALGAIDDPVALLAERPVAVSELWSEALQTLAHGHEDGAVVVHPSWWSAARVGVIARAARTLAGEVGVRPRSWLLHHAMPDAGSDGTAIVELAHEFAVISGACATAVLRRRTDLPAVAEEVARLVAGMTVVVDAACGVAEAQPLAALIADAANQAVVVDDARLRRLVKEAVPTPRLPSATSPEPRVRLPVRAASAGVALVAVALAVQAFTPERRQPAPAAVPMPVSMPVPMPVPLPTTFLVEGRVALTIPANWPTQRVVGGPGSARMLLTSPSDPEVALHITQSPVPGETLAGTAERLKRAIDMEPAGVFVDFNPSAATAGRAAVTYRELRAGHDVRWTVLLDGDIRISIGCQSRPAGQDAVREVCEQAVRSAHVVG